jgi:hypothetical protein
MNEIIENILNLEETWTQLLSQKEGQKKNMKNIQIISRFSRLLLFWTTGWVPSRGTYLLGLFYLGLLSVIFRIVEMIRNINLQSTELYTPVSRSCPSLLLEVYEKTSVSVQILLTNGMKTT